MDYKKALIRKISNKTAKVGIVGMGYVGMPLGELSAEAGFRTIGFVRDPKKKGAINAEKITNLTSTVDKKELKKVDIILICVQTPVFEDKMPDLRALKQACEEVSENLRPGQLVIIESSVAPGTTRKIVLPILRKSGLKLGEEFYLSFSPERVDPGNARFKLNKIPKVVSGAEPNSREAAVAFYSKIIDRVVPVSSVETAELVKIFENTFRLVNISLVNQVHQYAQAIGVDMWEVVDAASTKPFGFLPHYPGPGIGGHCIPVDPYYLLEDAKKNGINLTLVKEAGIINENQPHKVVHRAVEIISTNLKNGLIHSGHNHGIRLFSAILRFKNNPIFFKNPKKPKVLLIGVAYKPDIDDPRESPALKIWEIFEKMGYTVTYHDPYIPLFNGHQSLELSEKTVTQNDLLVITTNHSTIDYEWLIGLRKPILDTRNVLLSTQNTKSNIFGL